MKLREMENYVKELEETYEWHVDCMIEINHTIKEFKRRIALLKWKVGGRQGKKP